MANMKYPTAELLENAINNYFDKITYLEQSFIEVIDKVEKGKMYYKKEYLEDVNGDPIMIKKFAAPPKLYDLCMMLEIDRDTLLNYSKSSAHPEYSAIIKNARDRINAYHEGQLKEKIGATGSIFYLKCNHKWIDRQYIETTNKNLDISAELETYLKLTPGDQAKFIDELSNKAKEDIEQIAHDDINKDKEPLKPSTDTPTSQ